MQNKLTAIQRRAFKVAKGKLSRAVIASYADDLESGYEPSAYRRITNSALLADILVYARLSGYAYATATGDELQARYPDQSC